LISSGNARGLANRLRTHSGIPIHPSTCYCRGGVALLPSGMGRGWGVSLRSPKALRHTGEKVSQVGTSPKARDAYCRRLAEMTPSERLAVGAALWRAGDSLQRSATRRMHPKGDDVEITFQIALTRFGNKLARKAFGRQSPPSRKRLRQCAPRWNRRASALPSAAPGPVRRLASPA
jgi:hypothetical protein